jgi:hypothetical protein
MDKETRHELHRLFQAFEEALDDIRLAAKEDRELMGWRKVQTTAWELNQLLPAADHRADI